MKTVIAGKKTYLFPVTQKDINNMSEFLGDDEGKTRLGVYAWDMGLDDKLEEYLSAILKSISPAIWVAHTIEGKATRKIGYFWLNPITKYWVNLEGIIDNHFANGIDNELDKRKYTYLEDALKNVISNGLTSAEHIGVWTIKDDSPMIRLLKHIGFEKEGIFRKILNYDSDKFSDVIHYSIINKGV